MTMNDDYDYKDDYIQCNDDDIDMYDNDDDDDMLVMMMMMA